MRIAIACADGGGVARCSESRCAMNLNGSPKEHQRVLSLELETREVTHSGYVAFTSVIINDFGLREILRPGSPVSEDVTQSPYTS